MISKCETCIHTRLVPSENGWHRACCLTSNAQILCITGRVSRYIRDRFYVPTNKESEDKE
jgi:hypothetical protein